MNETTTAKVTVYAKTQGFCGPCMTTKKALTNAGIDFEVLSLEDQPAEVIEHFKATVGASAPIVITPNAAWSGFRPDLIAALAA